MKKLLLTLFIVFLLAGCGSEQPDEHIDASDTMESELDNNEVNLKYEKNRMFTSFPNLNEAQKDQIWELHLLWEEFEKQKRPDKDPSEDFRNSAYLAKLKDFLEKRENLDINASFLSQILGQADLESYDKKLIVGDKEYNVRVTGYFVSYWVQAITDIADIQSKYIFIQCWNDDEFYFTTVSNGDIYALQNYMAVEIDNKLCVVLVGDAWLGWPQAPFLWTWRLNPNGFEPYVMFSQMAKETDQYNYVPKIEFYSDLKKKWGLHTDGSFMLIEKQASAEGSEEWVSDYLNIGYTIDENTHLITFESYNRDGDVESTIQFKLTGNQFVIE